MAKEINDYTQLVAEYSRVESIYGRTLSTEECSTFVKTLRKTRREDTKKLCKGSRIVYRVIDPGEGAAIKADVFLGKNPGIRVA